MKLLLATIAFASISTQVFASGSNDACNKAKNHFNENFKSSELICDDASGQVRIVKPQTIHFGKTKNILYSYGLKDRIYGEVYEYSRQYDQETYNSLCKEFGLNEATSYETYNVYSYLKTGIYFNARDLSSKLEKQQSGHSSPLASITCR
jgi:hypothetical protein